MKERTTRWGPRSVAGGGRWRSAQLLAVAQVVTAALTGIAALMTILALAFHYAVDWFGCSGVAESVCSRDFAADPPLSDNLVRVTGGVTLVLLVAFLLLLLLRRVRKSVT